MTVGKRSRGKRRLKAAGFLLGLSLVAVAVAGWRVPAGGGSLGADVAFVANLTGELGVSPRGVFLRGTRLEPGGREAVGAVDVTNQTGRTLAVGVRLRGEAGRLDRALHVELRAGRTLLFRGSLGGLRSWSARSLALAAGQSRRLRVRAWLAALARGYEGRSETATLEFYVRPLPEAT